MTEETDRPGRPPKLTDKVVAMLLFVPGHARVEAGRMRNLLYEHAYDSERRFAPT